MAAGLGFKTFTTGEVLTAGDVNGYLMQGINVFASAAARDAAITSPQEGQCCYLKDTDAVLTYSGTAWVGFDDTNAIQNAIVNAKGDIIGASANDTPAITSVGADGTSLVADSSTATGLAYAARATLAANTFTADQVVNSVVVGRGGGNNVLNTVVGNASMASNTGQYNTAVGQAALNANTSGQQSTAVGSNALVLQTTGGYNTAVGMQSLSSMVSSGECTAVGFQSLGLTTANQNTAIGSQAGSNITSGANNTCIGYASQASSATVNNTITLGNSSIATIRAQVTSITSLSDQRDKKDIEPLEYGLDFVKQLKPVSFEWNTRPEIRKDFEDNEIQVQGKVGIADIGFIAQDIVALEDSLGAADSLQLSYRDNPEKLEVTQGRLIPILVKAIQDLTAKVEALEAEQSTPSVTNGD
jgi:hypothetical protein